MEELFNKITKELTSKESIRPFSNKPELEPVDFSENNFNTINKPNPDTKIASIDGGNIEIIGNSNFSLQLMRIYFNIYQNNKKIKSQNSEYIVLITTTKEDTNKLTYKAEIFNSEDNKLIQTINLPIEEHGFKQKPDSIISKVRRLFEIKAIKNITPSLDKKDIIIIDGSLETKSEEEEKNLNYQINFCKEKNIILCSVNKTSSQTTNSGTNLIGYVNSISNTESKWFYYPLYNYKTEQEIYNIKTITKLHSKNQYAFLIETISNTKDANNNNALLETLTSNLSHISKDPIFLGYPYSLIDADQNARCTENEKRYLETRFLLIGKDNNVKLKYLLNSGNAHSILDKINF